MQLGQSLPAWRASSRQLSKASSQAAAVRSVPAALHPWSGSVHMEITTKSPSLPMTARFL